MPLSILRPTVPSPEQVAQIRSLATAIAGGDGRDPLSDQALTQLSSRSVQHVLALDDDELVGYAQLEGDSLEVAARPDAVSSVLDAFADASALVWSHGEHSPLAAVLEQRGYTRERELYQLRRGLAEAFEPPPPPEGVELGRFTVGRDEDAWVGVNSRAFATHPEQGRWTRADLEAREREPWFDPSGFLLAWRGRELLGFHWTKVHPDGAGEVYVIGVDPSAQGLGLGAVLLLDGLDYLRVRGCTEVLLYVDGSNTGAMRLYERYGFTRHDLDVQWAAPADRAQSGRTQSSTGSVSKT